MTLGWIILIVVAHEEPHPEVVPQNWGLHELARWTAKAHRHMDSLGYSCCQFTPWNIGGSWERHCIDLCGASGVQFYGFMVCLVGLFMDLLAKSMGYIHGRLENNAASYHDTGCRASFTVQCTLYLQHATGPNGAAMSYPMCCSLSRTLNCWKLWPLAWTFSTSRKWLCWNIEWITRTLKDYPSFKQHYSYKNSTETYIIVPWALWCAACLPLRYFKRHTHTTARLLI